MINLNTINKSNLWYLVGLITSDGSLSKDGRHISITSKDEQILSDIINAFDLKIKITKKSNGSNKDKIYSLIQIGDIKLYKFLLSIGLSSAKSLTLGKLAVPHNYFNDFLRGEIDGDGCIFSWTNPANGNTQFSLRIVSAAPVFAKWLHEQILLRYKVPGKIYTRYDARRKNPLYSLKYGKLAAEIILKKCYYANSLCLKRKLVQFENLTKHKAKVRKYMPGWRNW